MESKIKILNNITNFRRISEPNSDMKELYEIRLGDIEVKKCADY